MPGLLGCGMDLGPDSKNDRKPGKGFSQAGEWCGVVRFASLEEHPGSRAKKEQREPKGV